MPSAHPSAAIAVSALITACVLPAAAQAQIVHFAPATPIRVGPGQSFDIDLDGNGTVDFALRMTAINPTPWGSEFSIDLSGPGTSSSPIGGMAHGGKGPDLAVALASRTPIDESLFLPASGFPWSLALDTRRVVSSPFPRQGLLLSADGDWVWVDQAIAGLRFLGSDGRSRFGWLNARSLGPLGGEVLAWGFESAPETPILAGAVPAPGVAALLMLGGALAARRQRNAALRYPTAGVR